MKLTRQARIVLEHLRTSHLTSWQAEGVYRIRRLASRINELKTVGFAIDKETMQDATGQRYTRYSLSRAQRRRKEPINPPVEQKKTGAGYAKSHIDCPNCGTRFVFAADYCHSCGFDRNGLIGGDL